MMSYLYHIKRANWIRRWSSKGTTYGWRFCSCGVNGAYVPDLTKTDEANISDFFLEHGVELNATHNLWWTFKRFGYHDHIPLKDHTNYKGGIDFEISEQAYNVMFNY